MLQEIFQTLPPFAVPGLGVVVSLMLWHFLTFTIRPLMRPSDPKELPYWIPYLGHAIKFFRSADKLIERGLDYTGRTHEPFSLHVLGKQFYIITAPADVTVAFRDTVNLSFDGNLAQLLQNFGVKKTAFERAWHKPQPGDWCYIPNNPINPNQLDLIHFVEDTFKRQLLPGEHMDEMSLAFTDSLLELMNWDRLDICTHRRYEECLWCGTACNDVSKASHRQVSLYSLCRYFIVEATTHCMFGRHLHDIDPKVADYMLEFNDNAWMVVYGYPDLFGNPVSEPRRRLMSVLSKFMQLPESQREQQSWSVKNIIAAMDIVGIDQDSRASMMLMSYWAAVSNEYNTAFWILAYLLYDESLLQRVKEETEAGWQSGQFDIKDITANCPCLDAILNETLRVHNGAGALRVVKKETSIGGKLLRPGNPILIPFRQLHTNGDVWGPDVGEFNPTRFLEKKSLARHPSFRPFGGGATFCPGRHLAREQVYGFISILLHRFDIRLACRAGEKPTFPRLNDKTPSLGVSGPIGDMDVTIFMTMAKNEGTDGTN